MTDIIDPDKFGVSFSGQILSVFQKCLIGLKTKHFKESWLALDRGYKILISAIFYTPCQV